MLKFTQSCNIAIFLFLLSLLNTSCVHTKQVIYLNNLQDTTKDSLINIAQAAFESPIQKNDQLWITVGGSNGYDLGPINSGIGIPGGGGGALAGNSSNSLLGYLVEADGKIQFPYIGRIKAEGLSRTELEKVLTELLKDYTKNPIVNVRFLNYNYSILGEIARSGRYSMQTERVSIFDAVSMAGDLTDLARRDNVLVIREVNGKRETARLNLLSRDVFKSPFFYLKTNDVVYVEPVKAKFISRTGVPQYISIIAVGFSLILTLINLRR